MVRLLLTLTLLMPSIAAYGQQQLRRWPDANGWVIALVRVRSLDGAPACLLMTGYDSSGPSQKVWGLRAAKSELILILNSSNQSDVSGNQLELLVDNYSLGKLAVTDRPAPARGIYTVTAEVRDTSLQSRLLSLLMTTDIEISVIGEGTTVKRQVSRSAISYFGECMHEQALLN